MSNYEKFKEIIYGSKEFTFDGSVLIVAGYYSGEKVKLDLGEIDEDVFKQLEYEADDDEEDY